LRKVSFIAFIGECLKSKKYLVGLIVALNIFFKRKT
jgi:hypothetical protein